LNKFHNKIAYSLKVYRAQNFGNLYALLSISSAASTSQTDTTTMLVLLETGGVAYGGIVLTRNVTEFHLFFSKAFKRWRQARDILT
jgi:hypothetical protein